MKIKVYDLPNGRKYFIQKKFENKYHILTFIPAEEILKHEENKFVTKNDEKIEARWSFISESDSMEGALETLCLFAHHRANDIKWLEQFSFLYEGELNIH